MLNPNLSHFRYSGYSLWKADGSFFAFCKTRDSRVYRRCQHCISANRISHGAASVSVQDHSKETMEGVWCCLDGHIRKGWEKEHVLYNLFRVSLLHFSNIIFWVESTHFTCKHRASQLCLKKHHLPKSSNQRVLEIRKVVSFYNLKSSCFAPKSFIFYPSLRLKETSLIIINSSTKLLNFKPWCHISSRMETRLGWA